LLSASTLDALKQFYAERDARAEQFAKLQAQAEEQHAASQAQAKPLSIEAFTEDWNESQFWVWLTTPDGVAWERGRTVLTDGRMQYSDETASFLAKQLLDGSTADMTIAVVSAPSVFIALKNLLVGPIRPTSPSSQSIGPVRPLTAQCSEHCITR
jgi:hypothetical protein